MFTDVRVEEQKVILYLGKLLIQHFQHKFQVQPLTGDIQNPEYLLTLDVVML